MKHLKARFTTILAEMRIHYRGAYSVKIMGSHKVLIVDIYYF